MSAKIELSLAPAKAKGLSEDERLDLGRLLLKAGYELILYAAARIPIRAPSTNISWFWTKERIMPDTRKNHNPSGAPDPTRVRAESNIQREEARVSELVHVLRYVAGAAGFEIVERIVLVDNQTGRIYR